MPDMKNVDQTKVRPDNSGGEPSDSERVTKITDQKVIEIVESGRKAADDIVASAVVQFRADYGKINSPAMRRSVLLNIEDREAEVEVEASVSSRPMRWRRLARMLGLWT